MKAVLADMSECTGCRACEQACAFRAVSMKPDEEGFYFPYIDEEKCVGCGNCRKACPAQNRVECTRPLEVCAAFHKDERVLLDSSSGGAFTALAHTVFGMNGTVIGCVLDERFSARQVTVSDPRLLPACRGSKYVQSDTCDTYSAVKEILEMGGYVLYTGTPCQNAGLKTYLGDKYDNLLTADFVCHGVPSPSLFKQHIGWLERKKRGKVSKYRFRSKLVPGETSLRYSFSLFKSEKTIWGSAALDPYYSAFLKAETYRECCYRCPYAAEMRVSDFTFADYWSVEKFHPELKNISGVSILTFNTAKGLSYKERIEWEMILVRSRTEWIKRVNVNLNRPAERPASRDTVYREITEGGYDSWADKYCSTAEWRIRNVFGKLPPELRAGIRKLIGKMKSQAGTK